MASGIGYYLPTAILVSIYKGLNELSRSSHPDRTKNFDAYKLVGEASSSPGMVKFSGLGRAKSFQPEEARELIRPQVLLPGRCNLFERNTTSAFVNGGPRCSSPHLAVHMPVIPRGNEDEGKRGSKPKLKIVRSRKPLEPFVLPIEDGFSRGKIPGIDDQPPVRVCEPSTKKIIKLPLEVAENIMDILDAEPNPTECMRESDDVNFKEGLAHVPLPSRSQCFPSVRQIPSFGLCSSDDNEVKFIRRVNAPSSVPRQQCPLRAPQEGISIFNADAVIKKVDKNATRVFGKVILDKVCHSPFDGLPSLRGDFDSLYATILQRGVDVSPLKSKVEGLIKQACDFKDLQQSYSG
ncbi:hypothetical protein Cgig2_018910 [Carnegiea gigantea]|uniref:Uncharacterized protein n=1 Tax=Carnegiea gigantea TaxID=171969 RepID=A0A9Q1QC90_9CARY|nr:hypothetical protein Cgig2_018910 [Carnegiea gigantea]